LGFMDQITKILTTAAGLALGLAAYNHLIKPRIQNCNCKNHVE
jgi:hypothetical protein